MKVENLKCWHCGSSLDDIPQPIGRREECQSCGSWLHVCQQCEFHDPAASNSCREPMAGDIRDKESANYCDYFRPRGGLTAMSDPAAAMARQRLNAIFEGGAKTGSARAGQEAPAPGTAADRSEADDARKKLQAVFGKD
ncbi:MAG: hypothetical protein OEZ59_05245 [Deltaproteobacteria bacterium]|nr:hypothetical protein [Deltaproteobacteria bacterium]